MFSWPTSLLGEKSLQNYGTQSCQMAIFYNYFSSYIGWASSNCVNLSWWFSKHLQWALYDPLLFHYFFKSHKMHVTQEPRLHLGHYFLHLGQHFKKIVHIASLTSATASFLPVQVVRHRTALCAEVWRTLTSVRISRVHHKIVPSSDRDVLHRFHLLHCFVWVWCNSLLWWTNSLVW